MRFKERKQWLYDPEVFTRADTATALKIHAEYVKKSSPSNPLPRFFEVNRADEVFDTLWHEPNQERTPFNREFEMPVIVTAERPDWRLTKIGLVPQQKLKVWMANLLLQEADWWPERGDFMFFNGYRHMIVNVVLEPSAFWQQTNVWLGLQCETVIPADGDARPVTNPAVPVPRELAQTRPYPTV